MREVTQDLLLQQSTLINGRYRPLAILGRGGMGWALQAEDSLLENGSVVLKFLYPHLLSNEEARMRLRGELLFARRLVHPNIVRTYNFFQDPEHGDNIVMEYVAGQTLRHRLNQAASATLPLNQALRYLYQILKGIEHAHALGVIHLDLKPENILLGSDGEAKIADFGLAQSLRLGQRASGLSGTPLYMAPEQFENGLLCPQTDLYSIGILAFELIAGRPPFQEATLYKLATQHCSEALPSLKKVRPEIPDWVEEMIRHCVEKSSASRFDSASSMLRALRSFEPELSGDELPQVQVLRSSEHSAHSYEQHPLLSIWRRRTLRFSLFSGLVALFCLFSRNIGWLHSFLLLLTLQLEKSTGQPMTLARFLFQIKAVPSESYYEAITEAGAVRGLLSIGKNPNELEPGTRRAIIVNLAEGGIDRETLELLLQNGANPNQKNGDGNAALHAVRGPNSALFAELLLKYGADPDILDNKQTSPLVLAVRAQNIPLVRSLLAANANPLIKDASGANAIDYAKRIDDDPRLMEMLVAKARTISSQEK